MKKVIRAVAFLLILVLLLHLTSVLFMPKQEVYNIVTTKELLSNLSKEDENTIDVAFFGDSECFAAYSPLQMYAEHGYTSYICATAAQRLCDTYAIMEEVFNQQSPKVVVLEANYFFRYGGTEKDEDDEMFNAFAKVFPVLKYHTRWKAILQALFRKGYDAKDNYKGFLLRTNVKPYKRGEYMIETDKRAKVPEENMEYLDKIMELCKANGAEVMIVSSPSPKNWSYERHNSATDIAEKYGLDFLDYNLKQEELGLNWQTDTKDYGDHVNFYGATKVTTDFGNYLSEHYDLPNHLDDSAYKEWTKLSLIYMKKYIE